MGKKGWLLTTCTLLALSVASVWAWSYWRTDPQMAKVEKLQNDLFAAGQDQSWEQRREGWRNLRTEFEKLSTEQQRQLRDEARGQFEGRMEQRLKDFFALTPAARTAEVDKDIDRMEGMRKRFEERRRQAEQSGQPRDRDRGRDQGRGDRGDGRRGGNGPGSGGSWRSDPQQRKERARRRLDESSPEMRAMRAEYSRLLAQRRRERGLPEFGRGGFGPPWRR